MSLEATEPKTAPREREPGRFGRYAEAFVLLVLAHGRSYGYEIRRRLEDLGYARVASDPGALYRLLRDLEAAGVIESEWDVTGTGPARRYYSLTDSGMGQLRRGAKRLNTLQHRIELFFESYKALDLDVVTEPVTVGVAAR
jgi:PadR family transcriptional regulator, regulatory protein PadR